MFAGITAEFSLYWMKSRKNAFELCCFCPTSGQAAEVDRSQKPWGGGRVVTSLPRVDSLTFQLVYVKNNNGWGVFLGKPNGWWPHKIHTAALCMKDPRVSYIPEKCRSVEQSWEGAYSSGWTDAVGKCHLYYRSHRQWQVMDISSRWRTHRLWGLMPQGRLDSLILPTPR